jgi:hypothetical protein
MFTMNKQHDSFKSPKGIAEFWGKDGFWHIALPCADPDPATGLRTGGYRWSEEFRTRELAVAAIEATK